MVNRRLVEYNISRLQDKRRDIRLKSIEELRLLGDLEALPALEEIYRTDDDPEIQTAAQNAGKEIFLRHNPGAKLP
jgi:uncharacterized pyridoxamine 5'-phosphate oxidase family protein